ncbi:hypothetical protein [Nitrosomonas sp. Nm58]|uniref:hypothetical protein n=1 Tax=Nitrosomonas sp. Nm58 TaxID=200126 RepID=UPI000B89D4C9|nr:hypothetical protein [Nitrosomonas sp. Nm58]
MIFWSAASILAAGHDNIRCSSLVATRPIQHVSPADGQYEGSAIFTDPPYGIHYANFACDKLRGTSQPILNDNLSKNFGSFLEATLAPTLNLLRCLPRLATKYHLQRVVPVLRLQRW